MADRRGTRKKSAATPWPDQPIVYEINTRVWLRELTTLYNYQTPMTLANLPDEVVHGLRSHGWDAVWLMGVWEPSTYSERHFRENKIQGVQFHEALSDFSLEDVVSSPYAVAGYTVSEALGGEAGLAAFRKRLAAAGIRLILDFVPNHLACDHPLVRTNPEMFVHGTEQDLSSEPENYVRLETDGGPVVFAHGKDPYFPGWADTVQLNHFHPETIRFNRRTLLELAEKCDGVRCDMAMLLMRDMHHHLWGDRLWRSLKEGESQFPPAAFWPEAIKAVKAKHPGFLFIAEVYWDLEWELQQEGFDYTYDKILYDRLRSGSPRGVRQHLLAEENYLKKTLHFLENHDEARCRTLFGDERSKAAAVVAFTAPGLRLFHDGQLEGREIYLPIHLRRRAYEEADSGFLNFYHHLLDTITAERFKETRWRPLDPLPASVENDSFMNFVITLRKNGDHAYLMVANLSDGKSQCFVKIPLWSTESDLNGKEVFLRDVLGSARFVRRAEEIAQRGLFLDLQPNGSHLFEMEIRSS